MSGFAAAGGGAGAAAGFWGTGASATLAFAGFGVTSAGLVAAALLEAGAPFGRAGFSPARATGGLSAATCCGPATLAGAAATGETGAREGDAGKGGNCEDAGCGD